MAKASEKAADNNAAPAAQEIAGRPEDSTRVMIADVMLLLRSAIVSPERKQLGLLVLGVVVVVSGVAYMQIRLNAWNQPFYDALSARNFTAFLNQLWQFTIIAGILLCLVVAQTWLQEMLKLVLRKQATRDLLDQWLKPGRAYRISRAGDIGVNPDQRMAEDVRHLTELSAQLAVGLFQSTLLLFSFVGVLWMLSRSVVFTWDGQEFAIPGYMVWAALFYSGAASWLSWIFGRKLISYNSTRYAREADLRVAMVRTNQHVDAMTLEGGEAHERKTLEQPLDNVLAAMRNLVSALTRLTWITSGYGWFALVAPIIVAAPAYFSGKLSFGALMMAVGAFNQVQQALRWFVDNFAVIADWQATLIRVVSFRQALIELDTAKPDTRPRIQRETGPEGELSLRHIELHCNNHVARLNEDITLHPGDRLLITGAAGVGKSTMFRSIAGLWSRGAGEIITPPRNEIVFLPRSPFLPVGTLRDSILYACSGQVADADIVAALDKVGLANLKDQLDRTATWDRELPMEQQQRVALVRAIIQHPRWIIMDEALHQIDPGARKDILTLFRQELADVGVIYTGPEVEDPDMFTKVIWLEHHERDEADEAKADGKPAATAPAPHASHSKPQENA